MSKDGKDNLIPINKRTKDEQREIQKKGGVASGKRRRDKRDFKEVLQALLPLAMTDKDGNAVISPITGKPMSIREQIATITIHGALKGDVRKLRVILDILGEGAQVVKQEISGNVGVDQRHIDLDKLTEEQKQALLSIGEDVLAQKEME